MKEQAKPRQPKSGKDRLSANIRLQGPCLAPALKQCSTAYSTIRNLTNANFSLNSYPYAKTVKYLLKTKKTLSVG